MKTNPTLKYEVTLRVHPSQGGQERVIHQDVFDTGNEQTNVADAIVGATLVLDNERIDRWSFVRCAKVTS